MNYTVVLQYPDYLCSERDNYFIDRLTTSTIQEAVNQARHNAARYSGFNSEDGEFSDDFGVVFVFEGHQRCYPGWVYE